jgi:hypothetical protein
MCVKDTLEGIEVARNLFEVPDGKIVLAGHRRL